MAKVQFDELIHAALRLRIVSLLSRVDAMQFSLLRDTLGVSDAVLSKHLKTLTDAGYVKLDRTASQQRDDERRITWLSLTPPGRKAFTGHVAALQELLSPENTSLTRS